MKLNPKLKTGIIIIFIITFFVVLNLTSSAKVIKNFFYSISEPIQKILWKQGSKLSYFSEMIFERKNLKEENEQLIVKILDLWNEKIEKAELEKENKALREALGLGLEKEFELKESRVIEKDISHDFILINRGAVDGLSENLPVITPQKILIGVTSEIYKNFSKVRLISDKESSLAVQVYEKEINGLVRGKGGFKISLEDLPKEEEIERNDIIITSSLSRIYPQGLLVARIEEVKKQDIEPYQRAEVKALFDISRIETVFIICDF